MWWNNGSPLRKVGSFILAKIYQMALSKYGEFL
uniref:Uncharacterized protein n=1 Tax=Physcomitrium patens TaxID=3218 RepID=A0A2K1I9S8_PHYPA|nr:hypothetical protein PHYPA_031201 [Physcomitrium patens]